MTAPGYVPPVTAGWWPKNSILIKAIGIAPGRTGDVVVVFKTISVQGIKSAETFGVVRIPVDGGNAASAGAGAFDGGTASSAGAGSLDGESA